MSLEKEYLVKEADSHLAKSNYVFLADFARTTVDETAALRQKLAQHGAEFHVVKNRILKVAAQARELPDMDEVLHGPTAIITGGESPSEVAKVLIEFHKSNNEKCAIKLGVIDAEAMSPADVKVLSQLPSKDVLRAQLLGLFNKPAENFVRVISAAPRDFLSVLQAKERKG